MPAGQLAMIANVSPQTASTHLAKLVDGHFLTVEQLGRHRYYRLADANIAHAIEALLAIAPRVKDRSADGTSRHAPAGTLAYARTCYSHLAGALAVEIADALQSRRLLVPRDTRRLAVTRQGLEWFRQLGIEIDERQAKDSVFARRCLDWTERRHHIAGPLGTAILDRFRQLKWIAPMRGSRAVRVTVEGERKLWELLRINSKKRDQLPGNILRRSPAPSSGSYTWS